jgi:hypothetical protein
MSARDNSIASSFVTTTPSTLICSGVTDWALVVTVHYSVGTLAKKFSVVHDINDSDFRHIELLTLDHD